MCPEYIDAHIVHMSLFFIPSTPNAHPLAVICTYDGWTLWMTDISEMYSDG